MMNVVKSHMRGIENGKCPYCGDDVTIEFDLRNVVASMCPSCGNLVVSAIIYSTMGSYMVWMTEKEAEERGIEYIS